MARLKCIVYSIVSSILVSIVVFERFLGPSAWRYRVHHGLTRDNGVIFLNFLFRNRYVVISYENLPLYQMIRALKGYVGGCLSFASSRCIWDRHGRVLLLRRFCCCYFGQDASGCLCRVGTNLYA